MNDRGPTLAAIGLFAALITIFAFFTGIGSLRDILPNPLDGKAEGEGGVPVSPTATSDFRSMTPALHTKTSSPTKVVIASSTPTPTQMPLPPTSTWTPVPPPTATPNVNTAPGSVLAPDQPWIKDGVSLSLIIKPDYFTPGGFESWGDCYHEQDLRFYIRIKNDTDSQIVFEVAVANFAVTASTGKALTVQEWGLCTFTGSFAVGPGITTQHVGDGPRHSGDVVSDIRVSVLGDYTSPEVGYLDIRVTNLSRIEEATWRMPIAH